MNEEVSTPLHGLRVLVIEDDAIIGMLYADVLMDMGHVICAIEATQERAVAAATKHKPDLMIVDATLSDGSGLSAVEEILCSGFIPHIFVSGDIASVLSVRPDAVVIQKPFRDPDLSRAIRLAFAKASPSGA